MLNFFLLCTSLSKNPPLWKKNVNGLIFFHILEKEERLTMRQRMAMPPDNGRLAASIDAKNQEIKLAMADKPLNEIEKSPAKEQMR